MSNRLSLNTVRGLALAAVLALGSAPAVQVDGIATDAARYNAWAA